MVDVELEEVEIHFDLIVSVEMIGVVALVDFEIVVVVDLILIVDLVKLC